ncbi:MAG TPA: hypothetical protein VNJ54_16070 [Plantibacter sp.]|uniref:arsenate reductase/protein-tyrosine-phosphatase family protein n=1 Tax=unclassified Plantibacter TaxID=2624265 RepID=UPI002B9C9D43|nr:hypothetical protein [Plantibacter sp.]
MTNVSPGVLAVCRANVCRSPLAGFRLQGELPAAFRLESLSVASAGTETVDGAKICAEVYRRLMPAGGAAFAAQHVASQLDEEAIAKAQLILTMTATARGSVGAITPSARAKTFTLVEAVGLLELQPSVPELDAIAASDDRVAAVAGVLNSRRGLMSDGGPKASRSTRRATAGLAILDAHTDRGARHGDVLQAVDEYTAVLVGHIERLVSLAAR